MNYRHLTKLHTQQKTGYAGFLLGALKSLLDVTHQNTCFIEAAASDSMMLRQFFRAEAFFVLADNKDQHARIDEDGKYDDADHDRLEHLQILEARGDHGDHDNGQAP